MGWYGGKVGNGRAGRYGRRIAVRARELAAAACPFPPPPARLAGAPGAWGLTGACLWCRGVRTPRRTAAAPGPKVPRLAASRARAANLGLEPDLDHGGRLLREGGGAIVGDEVLRAVALGEDPGRRAEGPAARAGEAPAVGPLELPQRVGVAGGAPAGLELSYAGLARRSPLGDVGFAIELGGEEGAVGVDHQALDGKVRRKRAFEYSAVGEGHKAFPVSKVHFVFSFVFTPVWPCANTTAVYFIFLESSNKFAAVRPYVFPLSFEKVIYPFTIVHIAIEVFHSSPSMPRLAMSIACGWIFEQIAIVYTI